MQKNYTKIVKLINKIISNIKAYTTNHNIHFVLVFVLLVLV